MILRHAAGDGTPFFTLYGHLSADSLAGLARRPARSRGARRSARVGAPPGERRLAAAPPLPDRDRPARAGRATSPASRSASQRARVDGPLARPEPAAAASRPIASRARGALRRGRSLAQRRALLGPSLRLSYRRPLKIVRGFRQLPLRRDGPRLPRRRTTTSPHVGHGHPRVVRAVPGSRWRCSTRTRATCTTASSRYAERLTRAAARAAARLLLRELGQRGQRAGAAAGARRTPGGEDVIVLEHAYHGHTSTLIDVSPYKFDGPGRRGRSRLRARGADAGRLPRPLPARRPATRARSSRASVGRDRERLRAGGGAPAAAFLCRDAAERRRARSCCRPATWPTPTATCARPAASCIADEVQVGFGRVGSALLGLRDAGRRAGHRHAGQADRQRPPAGRRRHDAARSPPPSPTAWSTSAPSAATRCPARSAWRCSTCSRRGLQENAPARRRARSRAGLASSRTAHAIIGDVRGSGLFLGVELVRDRAYARARAPRRRPTSSNRLRERGVLTGTDGPFDNVLKLRPPLVFSDEDAALFLEILDEVLQEDGARA